MELICQRNHPPTGYNTFKETMIIVGEDIDTPKSRFVPTPDPAWARAFPQSEASPNEETHPYLWRSGGFRYGPSKLANEVKNVWTSPTFGEPTILYADDIHYLYDHVFSCWGKTCELAEVSTS